MKPRSGKIRSAVTLTTAFTAGICLFLILTFSALNKTVLNSDFHSRLFQKHDISSNIQDKISTSIDDFISNMRRESPQNYQLYKESLNKLEESFTPDMTKKNLDLFLKETFQFLNGKRQFLPDININPKNSTSTGVDASTKNADNVLSRIDSINLSAVLMYINRNDISDYLSLLKFVFYIASKIPEVFLLLLLLSTISGLIASRNFGQILKWLGISLFTGAILLFIFVFLLFGYSVFMLHGLSHSLSLSIPLQSTIILRYIKDCVFSLNTVLTVAAIILLALSVLLYRIVKYSSDAFKQQLQNINLQPTKKQVYLKISAYVLSFILVTLAILIKSNDIRKDFDNTDFLSVISKFTNTNDASRIIQANNDEICGLDIRLIDSMTGIPISNADIYISGKSGSDDNSFNINVPTDDTGTARFTLAKGSFLISILSDSLPTEYVVPSPFFIELSSPGTKAITVNIEKATSP